jgi:hypothetical protein
MIPHANETCRVIAVFHAHLKRLGSRTLAGHLQHGIDFRELIGKLLNGLAVTGDRQFADLSVHFCFDRYDMTTNTGSDFRL